MTGLMDKIRAVLGRRGPQPRDASKALGSPATEGSTVPPGEPTLGAALGMNVAELLRRGEAESEPDARQAEDREEM
jgi:hypothetical protein